MKPTTLGVIPARYASSRLPGKPLMDIAGKPMIQHVYERTQKAKTLDQIVVATDDVRIAEAVTAFGGQTMMTRSDHPSGSDRVAEVADQFDCDLVVNIQGDEPFIAPQAIDTAVQKLIASPQAVVSTLVSRLYDNKSLYSRNTAKVVLSNDDFALYFSRAPIPFDRDAMDETHLQPGRAHLQHIGLYVFRKSFLKKFVNLPVCDLEQIEKLEQLRVLKNGYRIVCAVVDYHSFCVDTPDDLEKARTLAKELSVVG